MGEKKENTGMVFRELTAQMRRRRGLREEKWKENLCQRKCVDEEGKSIKTEERKTLT
jgi:hypothetical protein